MQHLRTLQEEMSKSNRFDERESTHRRAYLIYLLFGPRGRYLITMNLYFFTQIALHMLLQLYTLKFE